MFDYSITLLETRVLFFFSFFQAFFKIELALKKRKKEDKESKQIVSKDDKTPSLLLQLAPELLNEIAQFLTNTKFYSSELKKADVIDLAHFRSTSKYLNQFITTIRCTDSADEEMSDAAVRAKIFTIDQKESKQITPRYPFIECMDFEGANITDATAHEIITHYPNLRMLSFFVCQLLKILPSTGLKNLQKLSLRDTRLDGNIIQNFVTKCPNLIELDLANTSITDANLNAICASCLKLRSLDIHRCGQLQSPTITNAPALQSLNLTDCARLGRMAINTAPQLQSLMFWGCQRLRRIAINATPQLQTIDFTLCSNLQTINILEAENLKSVAFHLDNPQLSNLIAGLQATHPTLNIVTR